MFNLKSNFMPTGDQPQAIEKLTAYVKNGDKFQTLLGVTGSGKTFTMANVIKNTNRPTLIISHNKTLAAQLYQEFRDFFPENAVEYFVSYYDYYQPESYLPSTDTYIEKDSQINDEIDKLRLSATTSLMTRKDVIIVASVSCIYNLGSPAEYSKCSIEIKRGMKLRLQDLLLRLNQTQYQRSDIDFKRGTFRLKGEVLDIFPAYSDIPLRVEIFDDRVEKMYYFDHMNGVALKNDSGEFMIDFIEIFPAKHYIAPMDDRDNAIALIRRDLERRVNDYKSVGKNLEAYRIEQRTNYDLEMIQEIGYCKGIENYSRYFDGRKEGEAPYSLLDYFPDDYLLIVDESHITIPQVRGMFNGDKARKQTLIDYGFRLPSALDNRPLNFMEFLQRTGQTVFVSATPEDYEISLSEGRVAEQIIRPTGIIDPKIHILPSENQVNDLISKINERVAKGERTLVTTMTKRMAEELSNYLLEKKIKAAYLHSDIDTLERTNILDDLRRGNYDVLIGINLLREGLDLPEVTLVAILDADKEGFLRSRTALIQTMGRAARHVHGEVVMYADVITKSMEKAIEEVERRREIQTKYNEDNGITPQKIDKPIREKLIDEILEERLSKKPKRTKVVNYESLSPKDLEREYKKLKEEMNYEAEMLNFEKAALVRDEIKKIKKLLSIK
jgi:excinuclease ABC subunit B